MPPKWHEAILANWQKYLGTHGATPPSLFERTTLDRATNPTNRKPCGCMDFPVWSSDVWLRLPPHQPCSTWFQARVKDLKGKTWISEAFRQCRVHTHNLSAWCNLDGWKLMKFLFPTWISSGAPSRINLPAKSTFEGPLAHVSNRKMNICQTSLIVVHLKPKQMVVWSFQSTFLLGSCFWDSNSARYKEWILAQSQLRCKWIQACDCMVQNRDPFCAQCLAHL